MQSKSNRRFWVIIYVIPWFVIGFITAIILSKSAGNKSSRTINVDSNGKVLFSWSKVHWFQNSKLNIQSIATFPIQIHGKLKENVEKVYKSPENITKPQYTIATASCISKEGFVVHSKREYPKGRNETEGNPLFPPFSYQKFTTDKRNEQKFTRVISIPQPFEMDDFSFVSEMLPLLFILPGNIIENSVVCFTSVSPALEEFLGQAFPKIKYITSEKGTVCADEIIVPQISAENCVPQVAMDIFSRYLNSLIKKETINTGFVMRDGDSFLRRRDIIAKRLTDDSKGTKMMDKRWNIAEQCIAMNRADFAVGFGGHQMNLAMFMKRGSVVVEVQRDNVISQSVLIARALGMKVHVIPVRNGDAVSDEVYQTILNIIKQ